jgi:dTMP kinase
MKGRFISFEGIDGAGKSTHVESVAARLRALGHGLVCTREPGGTTLAEKLRELMLHRAMDPLTEALLVFAARRDHINEIILPALTRGDTVLCDRFTDASFAYQGGGRGLDVDVLTQLESWVQGSLQPDLTLWFDVSPELAAQRRAAAREADRFEQQDQAFFERVRDAYQARLNAAPHRFVRIDAALDSANVATQIANALEAHRW